MATPWSPPEPGELPELPEEPPEPGRLPLEATRPKRGDVAAAIRWAVDLVTQVLDVPMGCFGRVVGPGRLEVLYGVGPLGLTPGGELAVPEEFLAVGQSWSAGSPPTPPSQPSRKRHGSGPPTSPPADALSGLGVAVRVDDRPCQLVVLDSRPRQFSSADLYVVLAAGQQLTEAIERGHGESAHASVTEFGRFALASNDVTATIQRAVDLACEELDMPMGCLTQILRPARIRMRYARGPVGLAIGEQAEVAEELLATIGRADPYVVTDWRAEGQVPPLAAVRTSGALSSITAVVPAGGAPYLLSVLETRPRQYTDSEIDFVRSIAHLLATAIKRDRSEIAQAMVAEFGRFALQSPDIATTIERSVDLACQVLQAPIAVLAQVIGPDRVKMVHVRGPLGLAAGDELDVPEELITASGEPFPFIIGDWRSEQEFRKPSVVRAAGALSAISVVVLDGRWPGRLAVLDTTPREYSQSDVDFIQAVAHLLAAALERDQVESAQAAIARFGRLALQSRNIAATIERAMDLACEVLDAPLSGLIEVLHPGKNVQLYSHGPAAFPPGTVIDVPADIARTHSTSEPLVISDWDTQSRFENRPVLPPGVRATVSVTVPAGSRPWGRLIVMDTRPRRFSPADVDFIQSVAHLLAAAVERDRIETRLRETTRQLQHALLPPSLPVLEGIETTARYVPADGEVGGDWYDVLPLPYGGVGLVMGDVEGHDGTAAALMGQVRNLLRAYAAEGNTPAETLARVNQFVTLHTDRLVTCCFAELHPDEHTITCATAGHPAPLVLTPDGMLEPVPVSPGLLLGVDAAADYLEHTTLLPPNSRLLMFTDGLVDDCTGVVHQGHDALAAAIRTMGDLPLESMVDRLVARPPDAPQLRDDAALLAARLTTPARSGRDAVRRVWRSSPAASRAARHFVADILSDWQLPQLRERAVLAVSELVTNALVHTTSRIRLTLRHSGAGRVWIGVHDTSDRPPHPRTPTPLEDLSVTESVLDPSHLDIGGRGLTIVGHLADSWGVTPSSEPGGKTIWIELATSE